MSATCVMSCKYYCMLRMTTQSQTTRYSHLAIERRRVLLVSERPKHHLHSSSLSRAPRLPLVLMLTVYFPGINSEGGHQKGSQGAS